MDILLEKVLSARGDLIMGGETYLCYLLFLGDRPGEARERLTQLHFNTYFGKTRNDTSDKIVKKIYESRKILKPVNYLNSDPEIVMEAVARRVDEYLIQLEDFRQRGYVETTTIKMSRRNDLFIMRSCGENKVAALLALGHQHIPNVVVS